MFPANSKHTPVFFNKTMGGFNAYRLLRWIKEEASNPVEVPDFTNPDPFARAEELPDSRTSSMASAGQESPAVEGLEGAASAEKPSKADAKPAPSRQKPNPKNKAKAKIDDVMKELNDLRKGMKKDGAKEEL